MPGGGGYGEGEGCSVSPRFDLRAAGDILAPGVRAMPFAEVAVNSTAPHRRTFTYSLPNGLSVAVGPAVYAPFGSRTLQGVVLEVTDEPRFAETRDIVAVVDGPPLLPPERGAPAR